MRQFNNHGFSLIELLITIALFAIGSAIAIPNITKIGQNNAVKRDARQLKDSLAQARMEAIRRNQSVVILFNPTHDGYRIFEDKNSNMTYEGDGADPDRTISTINIDSLLEGDDIFAEEPFSISWGPKGKPTSFNVGTETIEVHAQDQSYAVMISMMGSVQIQKR